MTLNSFHYNCRQRLLPWLANSGNPGINPHTEEKNTGTHTNNTVAREGGTGQLKQPLSMRVPMLKKALTATVPFGPRWNPHTCA